MNRHLINLQRLIKELSHLKIQNVAEVNQKHSSINATFHQRCSNIVRVVWVNEPTPEDFDTADAIIQSHDGSLALVDMINQMTIIQLLTIKLSLKWNTLNPSEQALIDNVIDTNAKELLTGTVP